MISRPPPDSLHDMRNLLHSSAIVTAAIPAPHCDASYIGRHAAAMTLLEEIKQEKPKVPTSMGFGFKIQEHEGTENDWDTTPVAYTPGAFGKYQGQLKMHASHGWAD